MAENSFDVIVVGAGPAGLAAAKTCADGGLNTIVVERGAAPGSKNLMGGVLYAQPTAEVFPNFLEDAPLERVVVQQDAWVLTEDSAIKVGYRSAAFAGEAPNAHTVYRARLDSYFARQAEAAGALVICETCVDEVLTEAGKAIGVRVAREEGEVYSPVVIIAEGVNCRLVEQLGMQEKLTVHDAAGAVKEVIGLDARTIEQRFNVRGDEGATIECYGDATQGQLGTGFIYTNRETISVGVGTVLSHAGEEALSPYDALQRFKQHPMVAPLIEGGEPLEYGCHLIPEGGHHRLPKLFADGVMIVGDAAMLVNGLHREGSNHALISGKLAGQTAIEAHRAGDFTARTLGAYRERLWTEAPTLRDLRKYRNASELLARNPHMLAQYPALASDAMREMLTVDGTPKREKQWRIIRRALKERGALGLLWDGIRGGRSMW